MEKLQIEIQQKDFLTSYPIWIGSGVIEHLPSLVRFNRYSKVAVVVDEHTKAHWLPRLMAVLPPGSTPVEIKAGEDHKDLRSVEYIWSAFKDMGLDRKALVINLGGGVVGDLGGFSASTYMRGIEFVQMPTTLLSQVDASIGGKVGINFGHLKNLIGTFAQPTAVIIDIDTLGTLPKRQYLAGFSEIIKHGLIRDKEYLGFLCTKPWNKFDKIEIAFIVKRSCELKGTVVSADEKEAGPRKILNFGHTIGHALEALLLDSPEPVLHGEAVSVGMLAEARISLLKELISPGEFNMIEGVLERFELPRRVKATFSIDDVLEKIARDKKNSNERIKWTLLNRIGNVVYDFEVEEKAVRDAIGYVLDREISTTSRGKTNEGYQYSS